MPNSLLFDGVNDDRFWNPDGSFDGGGAVTMVVIVKKASDGAYHGIMGNALNLLLYISDVNKLYVQSGALASSSAFTVTAAEGWVLVGVSRAAGASVTPTMHKYVYGTSTWTHSAGDTAIGNADTTGQWLIGQEGVGSFFPGNILIAGVWDSNVADATIETLELDKPSWVTAAPKEAWRLEALGSIPPFVGTSTFDTATGATVDTGDAPAGWSDTAPPVLTPVTPSYTNYPKFKLARAR